MTLIIDTQNLIDDAKLVGPTLVELLQAISLELTATESLPNLLRQFELHPPANETHAGKFYFSNLADAGSLMAENRESEAVWPLRMSSYMYAQSLAESCGLEYRDLRSIEFLLNHLVEKKPGVADFLGRTLLLDKPLTSDLTSLWENSRIEFLEEWNQIEEGLSVQRPGDFTEFVMSPG